MAADSADLEDTTADLAGTDHDKLYSQSTKVISKDENDNNIDGDDDTEPETMDSKFFQLFSKYDGIISDYITDDKQIVPVINGLLILNATADRADLWSDNEILDDIQTDYLKFALIPSMLCKLYSNLNPPHRVKWLETSNYYAKIYLNTCDKLSILNKMDQNSFYKIKTALNQNESKDTEEDDNGTNGKYRIQHTNPSKNKASFTTGSDGKVILHPKMQEMFSERDELIARHKLDNDAKEQIDSMLKDVKSKHSKPPNSENKWKLFKDDENERQYWILKIQMAIRQCLRTIKQNMDELPLAMQMEAQSMQRKHNVLSKYDSLARQSNSNASNFAKNLKQWEPHSSANTNSDKMVGNTMSGKMNIQMIDKNGNIEKFSSLEAMKYGMDNKINKKIDERINARDYVFRDPNPWTYTPEEAATKGLLSEIPKDYFEKQKEIKMAELEAKIKAKRYAPDWELITNNDDGSQLSVGKIEYHKIGGVTQFTERDMPKQEDEKNIDDMTEQEYEQHIKEKRYWDAWKDDNTKGSGNPYFYG